MGDAGANLERQMLKNTVKDVIRLVGITPAQWEAEQKWWNMPLRFENNLPVITLDVNGSEVDFTPDQIIGMLLTKFHNDCMIGMSSFQLCLSHPVYFDQHQKQMLWNAAQIAGVDLIKLAPETTALSYEYGLFRKRDLTKDLVNVLFIDIGSSKTTLSLTGFSNLETKI